MRIPALKVTTVTEVTTGVFSKHSHPRPAVIGGSHNYIFIKKGKEWTPLAYSGNYGTMTIAMPSDSPEAKKALAMALEAGILS